MHDKIDKAVDVLLLDRCVYCICTSAGSIVAVCFTWQVL